MKKLFFAFTLFLVVAPVFAQDITGSWAGTLQIQSTKLRVVFNIEKRDSLYVTKMDSPDQGAFGLPTTRTSFKDEKLEIVSTGLGLFYQGVWQGDSIAGTFNQGGIPFPLVLKRTEKPQLNRPQMPQEPFPYVSEEIIIPNKKDSIYLSGTLTLPQDSGVFPAVLLIAGSGPNDRDETVFGHKPFLIIADLLTRNGFAVLRYDKRGVGKSEGDYAKATLQNFADDAKAAIDFLKLRKEIDKSRIGLIGHSEGGMIAPMVAAKNRDIAFIVSMAGVGIKGMDLILDQNETGMVSQHMEPETIQRIQHINKEILQGLIDWSGSEEDRTVLRDRYSSLWEQLPILTRLKMKKDVFVRSNYNAAITPSYRSFLAVDPSLYWQQITCPVFAINGEKDVQVLAEKNLSAIETALKKGGNTNIVVKQYPQLNHLFQESETGNVDEYVKIEQTISPQVLSDLTNWLKEQIK